jgi:uncharacterized protein (DUF1330 family)
MSFYFFANIRINDPLEYDKYLRHADEIFKRYKGEYLAVDNNPVVLEGSRTYSRAVLIRFPNEDDFRNWYYSDEYRYILKHRLQAADCDTVLIKGI